MNETFCPPAPAMIEALGISGNILESYNIEALAPISTPGGLNAGAFRGISRAQGDIYGFRLSNRITVVDDLTFVKAVPEPSIIGLFATGLFGLGFARRKVRS